MSIPFTIKNLGKVGYQDTWSQMKQFTEERTENTPDEFWVLEHDPVFTFGLAGKDEHMLNRMHDIPLVRTDRGGQVTYHGPGQVVIYTLIDIQRAKLSVRQLVERLEQGMVNYLNTLGIKAYGDRSAPGVYVDGKKIASLGLKIHKNATYHGISFNVAMDTTPFNYINVCGYSGLKVVQLNEFITVKDIQIIANDLVAALINAVYDPAIQINYCRGSCEKS